MRRLLISRELDAPAEEVFATLGNPLSHYRLAGDRVELIETSQDGMGRMLGVLDLRGPLGVCRRVATREVVSHSPSLMWGLAASNGQSVAIVSWSLEAISGGRTRVTLGVLPVRVGSRDRVLLWLGGRHVLSGILRSTLGRLDALLPAVVWAGADT